MLLFDTHCHISLEPFDEDRAVHAGDGRAVPAVPAGRYALRTARSRRDKLFFANPVPVIGKTALPENFYILPEI